MKKHARKLVLNRETLRHLENLRNAVGGGTVHTNLSACAGCGDQGGAYGYFCMNTCEACSAAYCATGGACSVSCPD